MLIWRSSWNSENQLLWFPLVTESCLGEDWAHFNVGGRGLSLLLAHGQAPPRDSSPMDLVRALPFLSALRGSHVQRGGGLLAMHLPAPGPNLFYFTETCSSPLHMKTPPANGPEGMGKHGRCVQTTLLTDSFTTVPGPCVSADWGAHMSPPPTCPDSICHVAPFQLASEETQAPPFIFLTLLPSWTRLH